MEMLAILEQNRDTLSSALREAETAEKAVHLLTEESNRLLVQYNETCESPVCRQAAAAMIHALQQTLPLMDTVGETIVWERSKTGEEGKKQPMAKPKRHAALIFLGLVCLIAMGVFTGLTFGKSFPMTTLPWLLGFLILGMIFLYAAGRSAALTPAPKTQQVEVRPDGAKIWRLFHAAVAAIDQDLTGMERAENYRLKQGAEEENVKEDPELWDLFASLLEASETGDGEYALDQIPGIRYYLYHRGIEVVEYSEETKELFDMMPAEESRTLRPAFTSSGRVLKRGLAAESVRN